MQTSNSSSRLTWSTVMAVPSVILSGAALWLSLSSSVASAKERPDFSPSFAENASRGELNGAIFQGEYTALTSGWRAGRRGDLITVDLIERTVAQKATSAKTGRDGNIGISPPLTGLLNVFSPSDVKSGGNQSFKGDGSASQSNLLSGQVTVTVVQVYPNGTMLVRGEKIVTLNRGDERVQFAGIVRAADINSDNRVSSSRVADARILYTGKGEIARASRQGWLQRFFSVVSPF